MAPPKDQQYFVKGTQEGLYACDKKCGATFVAGDLARKLSHERECDGTERSARWVMGHRAPNREDEDAGQYQPVTTGLWRRAHTIVSMRDAFAVGGELSRGEGIALVSHV